MARVSVNELFDGRSASADFSLKKEYKRKWEVITDDPYDDEDVAGAPGGDPDEIPAIGEAHPDKPFAYLNDIEAEQHPDSPYIWYISGTYTTGGGNRDGERDFDNSSQPVEGEEDTPVTQSPASQPETPLERVPAWKFSFEERSVNREKDEDDKPFVNAAGLPFDPPPEIKEYLLNINITFTKAKFSTSFWAGVIGRINAAAWRGFAQWTLLVKALEASSKYERGVYFWDISITLSHKPDTWFLKILDAGYAEKVSEGGIPRIVMIDDGAGKGPSTPWPLKENGQRIGVGDAPRWLEFRCHKGVNLTAVLGF